MRDKVKTGTPYKLAQADDSLSAFISLVENRGEALQPTDLHRREVDGVLERLSSHAGFPICRVRIERMNPHIDVGGPALSYKASPTARLGDCSFCIVIRNVIPMAEAVVACKATGIDLVATRDNILQAVDATNVELGGTAPNFKGRHRGRRT